MKVEEVEKEYFLLIFVHNFLSQASIKRVFVLQISLETYKTFSFLFSLWSSVKCSYDKEIFSKQYEDCLQVEEKNMLVAKMNLLMFKNVDLGLGNVKWYANVS